MTCKYYYEELNYNSNVCVCCKKKSTDRCGYVGIWEECDCYKANRIASGADNVGIVGDRLITNKNREVTISKDPVKVSGFYRG